MNNDVDNSTDPFAAPAGDSPVPGNLPQGGAQQQHTAVPGESVDAENQPGPVDLTGMENAPNDDIAPSAPLADPPVAEPVSETTDSPPPRVKEPKKSKAAAPPAAASDEADEDGLNRQWYILKVQTNREESIRDALQRRVAMAGLEKFFGEIIVPTEMVSEFKGGKKRVSKRKLYPGYIVVNMEINDDTWYLVRETSGIGDFTGAMGRPTPMAQQDVDKIVAKTEVKTDEAPRVDIRFKPADRVRIKEGTFENFEGNVEAIDQANGRVTVMINIFGRSTPVELEYWQIEAV